MDSSVLLTLGYGMYVVGAGASSKLNAQISNAVMQVTGTPARIAVAINKSELTHDMIVESGAFAVSVLSDQAPLEFIGRFGFYSGRE